MQSDHYIFTTFVFYSVFAFIATLLNLIIVLFQKSSPVRSRLLQTLALYLFWAFITIFMYATTEVKEKAILHNLSLSLSTFIPVFFLITLLTLAHVKQFLNRKWVAAYFLFPAFTTVLIMTNDHHHLVWQNNPVFNLEKNLLIYDYWRWYYSGVISVYFAMVMLSVLALYVSHQRVLSNNRMQFMLIVTGIFTPVVGEMAYFYGKLVIPGYNPTMEMFAITLAVLTLGIYTFRLISMIPIQLQKVLDLLPEGVMVLDPEDKLIYQNYMAGKLIAQRIPGDVIFPASARNVIGGTYPLASGDLTAELTILLTGEKQIIYKQDQIIKGDHDQTLGRIVIFRDITKPHQIYEREITNINLTDQDRSLQSQIIELDDLNGRVVEKLITMRTELDPLGQTGIIDQIDAMLETIETYREDMQRSKLLDQEESIKQLSYSETLLRYLEHLNEETSIEFSYSLPDSPLDHVLDEEICAVLISLMNHQIAYAADKGMGTLAHIDLFIENNSLSVNYFDNSKTPEPGRWLSTKRNDWIEPPRIESRLSSAGSNISIHFPKANAKKRFIWNLSGKRLLIADEQQLSASTFGAYFLSLGMTYLGNIHDRGSIESSLQALQPDILLLSVDWPRELISNVFIANNNATAKTSIILIGENISDEKLFEFHDLVSGFISREQSIENIVESLSRIVIGEKDFPPSVTDRIKWLDSNSTLYKKEHEAKVLKGYGIKEHQLEIMFRIVDGETYKEIAKVMDLSESAIKYHAGEMMKTLGVGSKTELIQYYFKTIKN